MGKMRLGEWLIHNRALSPEQVQTALAYARQWRCKLGDAILELRLIPREQFMRLLAGHLNVPFIRGDQLDKVPVATLHSVPAEMLSRLRVCPLKIVPGGVRGSIYVATSKPDDLKLLDEVTFATNLTAVPVLALPEDIERVLRRNGIIAGRYVEPIELPPEEDFRVEP